MKKIKNRSLQITNPKQQTTNNKTIKPAAGD